MSDIIFFAKKGEANPAGLPESSIFISIEFLEEEEAIIVEFCNNTRFKYFVGELGEFPLLRNRLEFGWKAISPGQVFYRYIRGKCHYEAV